MEKVVAPKARKKVQFGDQSVLQLAVMEGGGDGGSALKDKLARGTVFGQRKKIGEAPKIDSGCRTVGSVGGFWTGYLVHQNDSSLIQL